MGPRWAPLDCGRVRLTDQTDIRAVQGQTDRPESATLRPYTFDEGQVTPREGVGMTQHGTPAVGGLTAAGWAENPRDERLMTPSEVASLFGVDPRTVTRWATAGRLTPVRTPGGHRRYRRTEVMALRDALMSR